MDIGLGELLKALLFKCILKTLKFNSVPIAFFTSDFDFHQRTVFSALESSESINSFLKLLFTFSILGIMSM